MLTQGMYGHEFSPTHDARFGLICGQMRGGIDSMTHNSGWYNANGEKLGWGDLSLRDFNRIAEELEPGEVFIILSERDSFWNFVEQIGMIGALCKTNEKEQHPGRKYMQEKAMYIIRPGEIFYVKEWESDFHTGKGIKTIGRKEAQKLF